MEPIRNDANASRPRWEIDRLLARLADRAKWAVPARIMLTLIEHMDRKVETVL